MPAWTPAFLGPALKTWLKADALTGLNDTDPVASWLDSSGNGETAVQGTGAAQPLYIVDGQNGLPIVRFDGIDDFLSISTTQLVTPPVTVALAVKDTGSAGRYFQSSTSALIALVSTNDAQLNAGSAFTYSTGGLSGRTWHTHVLTFNGASSIGSLDGTQAAGGTGANVGGGTLRIASTGAASFLSSDWGDLCIIAGALSAENFLRLEGYLAHKWDIPLVGGHAYEAAPPVVTYSGFAGVA